LGGINGFQEEANGKLQTGKPALPFNFAGWIEAMGPPHSQQRQDAI